MKGKSHWATQIPNLVFRQIHLNVKRHVAQRCRVQLHTGQDMEDALFFPEEINLISSIEKKQRSFSW